MFGFAIILIASFVFSDTKTIHSQKCYDAKQEFYPYLSTRTAYQFVRGNITRPSSDCEALQIWMMSRHAARYSTAKIVKQIFSMKDVRDQIVKNHEEGAGELCPEDLKKLRQWQLHSNVSIESADTIVPQGKKDLQMLAQRLRDSFPELFKSNNTDDYHFASTAKASATQSLRTFATELVGSSTALNLDASRANDTLLIPHNNCPAWVNSFVPERIYAERNKFTTGPEVEQLLKDFSRRLGYSNTLDISKVKLIYDLCRLETAWNPDKLSTWCTLFNKDELTVLEYREDLDFYYCCGPGNKKTAKLNCPSVRDMFQRFEKNVNGSIDGKPKGVLYFAHTTNIQSLMSALHIRQEPSPLLASTFESSKNRIYRTSLIGPFNANLIAVLYKCRDTKSPYKVMFYLNENLVKMDGCDNGLCDWQLLKQKFEPEIKSCSLNFCYENLATD